MRKCIKCLVEDACAEYVVNKDMAYCRDCAVILHLGESKESRMFKDFQGEEAPGPAETGPVAGLDEEPKSAPS